jgi:iron complex outermembrane receptor protein
VGFLHTEDLANVDRIEVLKGPASILYGRAEPGGIINFVTKQPQNTPSFSAMQRVGSYGFSRTDLDATGPVGSSPLSYRVVAAHQANGNWLDHYSEQRNFIAPSLSLDIGERTRTTLQMEYSELITEALAANLAGRFPISTTVPPTSAEARTCPIHGRCRTRNTCCSR